METTSSKQSVLRMNGLLKTLQRRNVGKKRDKSLVQELKIFVFDNLEVEVTKKKSIRMIGKSRKKAIMATRGCEDDNADETEHFVFDGRLSDKLPPGYTTPSMAM